MARRKDGLTNGSEDVKVAVRKLRAVIACSQERFGELLHVGRAAIRRWEVGGGPTLQGLEALELLAMEQHQELLAVVFREAQEDLLHAMQAQDPTRRTLSVDRAARMMSEVFQAPDPSEREAAIRRAIIGLRKIPKHLKEMR